MPTILIDGQANLAVLYPPGGVTLGQGMFIRVSGIDLTAVGGPGGVISLLSGTTEIWATEALNNGSGVGGIALNVNKERTIDCLPGQSLVFGNPRNLTVKGSLQVEIFGNPYL